MKKLLFVSFIFIGSLCNASNLEFSRVILIDGTVIFSQTVPPGKVWEIKSATKGTQGNYPFMGITINGKYVALIPSTSSSYNGYSGYNLMPFWVPEGTVLSGGGSDGLYSVIEYSVVP
jgi:hypothetical protein